MKAILSSTLILFIIMTAAAQNSKLRDWGVAIGIFKPGLFNDIIDVPGVKVGHTTLREAEYIRTGVTVILPHNGNIFQQKVPAAIYIGNGFGKLTGYSQVEELGNLETPIVLTNTLSVPQAASALISYTLSQVGNESVRSINPVVGETNDGYLNDIRGKHVKEEHILTAIKNSNEGPIDQGNVGAGTGTVCFGFKGGIGSSSWVLPDVLGGYKVGVLVQSNFGGVLEIAGIPVGKLLERFPFKKEIMGDGDGSCMIVVATDAPLDARNLKRLAKRSMMGMAKTGASGSNGSGDYAIAFSTHPACRIPYQPGQMITQIPTLHNDHLSPLFQAVIESTEEAIINSLLAAESMQGYQGRKIEALPKDQLLKWLKEYHTQKNR